MTITYQGGGRIPDGWSGTTTTSNPATASINLPSGTRVLWVSIVAGGTTARAGGDPTFNGIKLLPGNVSTASGGTPEVCIEDWYLLDPPTGSSYTLSIPNSGTLALAINYAYASATNPMCVEAIKTTTGSSTNPTSTLYVGENSIWFAGLGNGGNTFASTARAGTTINEWDAGTWGIAGTYGTNSSPAASTTINWTFATSEDWVIAATTFKEMQAPTTIQYVGGTITGKAGAASGNSTIALDSGLTGGVGSAVQAGDLVVAYFAVGSTADRSLTISDGTTNYTLIDSERYANASGFDTNLRVAYKFMGTTPDTTTTFGPTGSTSDSGMCAVRVYRGVDPSSPIISATGGTSTSGDTNPDPGLSDPFVPGSVPIVVGAGACATATAYTRPGDLSGWQSAAQAGTNDVVAGAGHDLGYVTGARPTDATYNPMKWYGGSANFGESSAYVSFSLRQAGVGELIPASTSNNGTWSGLTGANGTASGLRNADNTVDSSVWGSDGANDEWLRFDLGAAVTVKAIRLMAIGTTTGAGVSGAPWGVIYTNGATIQSSTDDSVWTTRAIVSGLVDDTLETQTYDIGVTARYWRISKAGWLGVGDFILYGPYANITVANAAHGHTASSPTIGSKASITINSATHGHSASQPAITSHLAVTPNSANHAHSASNVTVASKASVSASGASHAHAATSPTIAPKATIATASANHGLTSTTLTITSKASITVSGAAHAHSASSPAISPKASIAAASAHHNLASTSPTITSKAAVVVSAAAHAHSASSPAISPKASLVVASAVHAVASTNPTLSFKSTISINGAVSAHIATSPAISPKASVTVGSSSHGLSSTSPAITPKASLTVAGATHAHSVTSPAVVSRASLTVSAAQHGHTATQPSLTAKNAVTVTSAVHAHSATSPSIVPKATISVGNANHALSSTNPTITPRATLAIAAAHHAVASTGPSITPSLVLPVQSASHAHSASSPTVIPKASITVGSALHSLSSTSPGITSKATLSISAAHHALSSIGPTITPRAVLTIAAASHAHSATSPGVAFAALLAVNDNTHGHICTSPALALTYSLAPADAYHLHIAESPAVRLFVSPSERRNVHTSYLSRNEATVITSRDGVAFNWPRNRATALGSRIAAFPARSRIR